MILSELFKNLELKEIAYVVWKSFEDIDLIFSQQSIELDIYVPNAYRNRFRQIANKHGFTLRKTSVERFTDFFYMYTEHRIIMLHIAYKIITGAGLKNIALGTENDLLSDYRYYKNIRITPEGPYLFYHVIKFILLGKDKHFDVLMHASEDACAYVDKKMKEIFGFSFSVITILRNDNNYQHTRKKLKRKVIIGHLHSYIIYSIRHTADRILTRMKWVIRRRGFDIAFIGVDGSGKSSLCAIIRNRIEFLGAKKIIYMGPKVSWKPLSFIDRCLRLLKGKIVVFFGGIAIYDRYLYDALAYRRLSPMVRNLLYRLIPAPRFVFHCDTDIDIILNRKFHDTPDLLKKVANRYNQTFSGKKSVYTLDTHKEISETVADAMNILEKDISRSFI